VSFVVSALTVQEKMTMLGFLHTHDVRLPPSGDFQAFGSVSETTNTLMGVVAFNGFWGHVCTMHTAGEGNWISRKLIWRSFDYPFRQLGLRAVLAPVAASNERALRFDRKIGFKEVHRVSEGWDAGDDLIVLQLLREDCHWLPRLDQRYAH
jgi:L-amino acid N-acyltransferase YncA